MCIRGVPFSSMHLGLMKPDQFQVRLIRDYPDLRERVIMQSDLGPSGTLLDSGLVIASFGLCPLHSGVAEAWLWRDSDRARTKPITYARLARRVLCEMATAMRLHRAQTHVNAQNLSGIRFMIYLDFNREGLLHNYGPDRSDYLIFSRIF